MAKYVVFIECDSKDYDKIVPKARKSRDYREKHPENYPKIVLSAQRFLGDIPKLTKDLKGFNIIETDDLQKFVNMKVMNMPEVTTYIVPIVDLSEFQDTYLKSRK